MAKITAIRGTYDSPLALLGRIMEDVQSGEVVKFAFFGITSTGRSRPTQFSMSRADCAFAGAYLLKLSMEDHPDGADPDPTPP